MGIYEDFETDYSSRCLQTIADNLDFPVCIIGGWAVYYTVNEHFKNEQGRNYLGSKDVDFGFYIDKTMDKAELEKTPFGKFIKILLENLKFKPQGFRFYKDLKRETGESLTSDESKHIPSYEMFKMYVDPIFNVIHPNFEEIFGFKPLDEPLLSIPYEDREKRIKLKNFKGLLWLPKPEILLATKIKSAPTRTRDHKLIKDICDIYALSWYSGDDFSEIRKKTRCIMDLENFDLSILSDEIYKNVETSLGISKDTVKLVIEDLLK